ncbi:hypothetical protein [Methylobacter sp. Wu1]|uniref:hypothetical protein n=1 Tax=Methylobacter sp. Wu1 TaxID=3119359 RepID=UPI002F959805
MSAGYIASGFIFGSLTDIFHLLLPLLHSRRFSSFPDLLFVALTDLLAAALILMDSSPDLLLPSFLKLPRRVAALPAPPQGPAWPDAANAKVEAIINTLTICLLDITSFTNRVDRPDISAIKIG